jgi:hypothetical protein
METQPVPEEPTRARRFRFDLVLPVLFKPRTAFREINAHASRSWLTPLLIVTLAALLLVVVGGPLRKAAAEAEAMNLPPEFQYYTPEQQAQITQGRAATSSPTFIYVFPALGAVLKVWIGWLAVGATLHLFLTFLGSRGTMASMMNLVAWAGLPFAVRDVVRSAYTMIAHRLIQGPGLSGLIPSGAEGGALFAAGVLGLIDLYLIWHIALLVVASRSEVDPGNRRALGSVLATQVIAILLQALPAFAAASLGNLTVVRPFLF